MAATTPEALPADEGPWIEGRFEGIYAGDRTGERRDGARRFEVRVQSGALLDASVAEAPDADLRADPSTLRQDRLAPVNLPAIPAIERCARPRETALFDVHITEWRLKHPAEQDGRGFGTIEGTLRGRLAPEVPMLELPPDEPEPRAAIPALDVTAEPAIEEPVEESLDEIATPIGHPVSGADAAAVLERFWWLAALFGFALFAFLLGGLCSPRTAALWGAGVVGACALRRFARPIVTSGTAFQGWMGGALVVAQLAALVGPLEASWQAGCRMPIEADLAWIAAPMLLAALLRHPAFLTGTIAIWTLVVCTWCTQLDGACVASTEPAAESAPAAAGRQRTDAGGRWPSAPGGGGTGGRFAPDGGFSGGFTLPGGIRISSEGIRRETTREIGAGVVDEASRSEDLGRGSRLATPLDERAIPARDDLAPPTPRPGRVTQIPGGWVAPDHRRTERALVLISVEQANRTPDAFFASEGSRRVYLPTDPLFEDGTARLRSRADLDLTRLAAVLSLHPERKVVLDVHTDAAGAPGAQEALAGQRAEALRSWLLDRGHLRAEQFSVEAVGGALPLVPPDGSYAAQQPNRRIEVRLVD